MVTHDKAAKKFLIENPEGTSYLEYTMKDGAVTVLHTVVPKPLSGHGLAGQLAEACFQFARNEKKPVRSECSYMTAWLKRHPLQ